MSNKIAVVGDKASVECFKTLGLDTFETDDARSVRNIVNKLAADKYAVIYITEQAAQMARETIDKYTSSTYPAIIPIPSNKGSLGIGMANIRKNVEKAVGTDIFNN